MIISTSRILSTLALFVIVGLCACEEENTERKKATATDQSWFPLEPQREWRYERWINNMEVPPGRILDTLTLSIQNEVTVDGKVYREIESEHGVVDKLVRIDGSKYFARHHELYTSDFTHEYVFLDTDKAVGESWHYIKDEGNSKTEYVIQSKDATHTIHGKIYTNVIEVKVNYYYLTLAGEFEASGTVMHYYAKGVGEIYHYYPYPTLMYGDISAFIMPDKK